MGIVNAADNTTEIPVASFSADITEGKVPLEVQFTDTSSGDPTSWLWDFGDGEISKSPNASYIYTEPGTFNVSLTVSNENGSNSVTETIKVLGTRPIVRISSVNPSDPIEREPVNFRGEIIYNDSAIIKQKWSDEDGFRCPQMTLTTAFLAGNHTIYFEAMDSEDEWSERAIAYLEVRKNTPPIATIKDISLDSALKGEEVTFIGSGTDDDGVVNGSIIHEYSWESDIDTFLSEEPNFSTSSLSVGTHTITFWVRDHYKKSKEVTAIIKIIGNTEYLQVSSEKAISVNNPVNIMVDVNDTNFTSLKFSITDNNDNIILTKDITDEMDSGIYTFEWNATDSAGEQLQSGAYNLSLIGTDSSDNPISEAMILNVDHTLPLIVIDDITGVIEHEDVVYASSDLTVTMSESDGDIKDVNINLLSDSGSQVKTIDADRVDDGTWVGEFDLSSVPDGNYTVEAVAKDTANNINSTTSNIKVNVDGTAPILEDVTPSKDQKFAVGTNSVDIRFNYSDSGTGINASSVSMKIDNRDVTANATINEVSASYKATGLDAGSYTATLYVADSLGNIQKFSTNFVIAEKSSRKTSSSSSGGGGGSTGEKYENILVKEVESIYVTKDSRISYEFTKDGNAITSVHFDALRNAGTISTIVEVLKDRSTFAKADAPGNVYQQMNIWVGKSGFVDPDNVENLGIGFMVEKTWLEENNIESDTVKLYRYSNESWTALDTEVTEEDDDYVYFESQTPGFSPFAISSEAESEELTDEAILQSVSDDSVASDGEPIQVKTTGSESSTFVFVILGGLLVVLIGAYLIYRKGK
ncbi:MAG: hypothetical protein AWU59_1240 [Methanolobus sp. T82-4]|nr:MAG: hypothetical protein AWU59_1240 [Methanolobus sp. T82-4]